MTTLQTHGGGAQPASIDTSGKVTGGAALRVYGFDSEADAIAAGYVCEGGPAMSVALITDAQIASGAWKAEGDPAALAVYTAPASMPIEGGLAVPVYPVNGWGSAPAPVDPGIALRADALRYWLLQSDLLDSLGHSNSLLDGFTLPQAVAPVTFSDSSAVFVMANNVMAFESDNADMRLGGGSFTVCAWLSLSAKAETGYTIIGKSNSSDTEWAIDWRPTTYENPDRFEWYVMDEEFNFGGVISTITPLTLNQFYFIFITRDIEHGLISIRVNAEAPVTAEFTGTVAPTSAAFAIGGNVSHPLSDPSPSGDFDGNAKWVGIWKRVLSDNEHDYLYNSGAGRALFPAP